MSRQPRESFNFTNFTFSNFPGRLRYIIVKARADIPSKDPSCVAQLEERLTAVTRVKLMSPAKLRLESVFSSQEARRAAHFDGRLVEGGTDAHVHSSSSGSELRAAQHCVRSPLHQPRTVGDPPPHWQIHLSRVCTHRDIIILAGL